MGESGGYSLAIHIPSPLRTLRETILALAPGAEEGISYGAPAFKLQGKVFAGFAAFKTHLSYLPHSGSVLGQIPDDVVEYAKTKGALQFPIDQPLPRALVRKLIDARLSELGLR